MSIELPSVPVGASVIDVDLVARYITTSLTSAPDLETITEFIGELVDEVWAQFVGLAKQPLDPDDSYQYDFRGKGKSYHVPSLHLVNDIDTLSYHDGEDWVDISDEDYRDDTSDGYFSIDADFCFVSGRRYRAVLDVGYAANDDGTLDLPGNVVTAIKYMAVMRWFDSPRGGKRFGMSSEGKTSNSMSATTGYTRKEVEAMWFKAVKSQMPL